ncbi:MAG: UbiA prenyltransferase family protein [Planctomycetota bacterium]|nr:UbiA prenyltransferase family protein [Planctomycetota bacterium]
MQPLVERRPLSAVIWPYVQIARPDHWFKNAFMLLGVALAFFWRPDLFTLETLGVLTSAFFATCVIASSNYVINELLDAETDRLHPVKCNRPAACGEIVPWIAILLWGSLGTLGILWAFAINGPFGAAAFGLWVMGCVYNVRPVRSKEVPFLDVITESVNNPIRLLLGWFALVPDRLPPISLALAYWMVGAFFMATKRYAEYRAINDPERAASYRSSFRHYDEQRLLASMVFYLTAGATFSGIFIVRYKPELILSTPIIAGFFAYYLLLGQKTDSPMQNPEKLYRERGFFLYALFTTCVFLALMFIEMPALYEVFNVRPSTFEPLWRIG